MDILIASLSMANKSYRVWTHLGDSLSHVTIIVLAVAAFVVWCTHIHAHLYDRQRCNKHESIVGSIAVVAALLFTFYNVVDYSFSIETHVNEAEATQYHYRIVSLQKRYPKLPAKQPKVHYSNSLSRDVNIARHNKRKPVLTKSLARHEYTKLEGREIEHESGAALHRHLSKKLTMPRWWNRI